MLLGQLVSEKYNIIAKEYPPPPTHTHKTQTDLLSYRS